MQRGRKPGDPKRDHKSEKIQKTKKQPGIQLDQVLWRKFRARCIEEGVTAGNKVEELIQGYLESIPNE
jgi:hypothetical protein